MRIPIFGFHILSDSHVQAMEFDIESLSRVIKENTARVVSTRAELDSTTQRLEASIKASTADKHKAAVFADAVSLQLNDAMNKLLDVEKLVIWRNSEEFKSAGPRARSEFPSKLSEAYDGAAQAFVKLFAYINSHKQGID